MKTKKRGMLWVDRERDRRSYAILAQIFGQPTLPQHKKRGGAGWWARFRERQGLIQKLNFPEIMPAGRRNVLGCCGACRPSGKCHRDRRGRFEEPIPSLAERFSERPGAVKGAPTGASEAALYGEDRSGRFPARREWPPSLRL